MLSGRLSWILFAALLLSVASFVWYYVTPTDKTASHQLKVVLDYQTAPSFIGFYVAHEKGFFDNRNLNVDFVNAGGAIEAATHVANGTYNVGTSSGQSTLLAIARGGNLVSVAVLYPRIPTVSISRNEKNIREPRDIIGKTIGINASSATVNDFKWLKRTFGINDSDVVEQGVGTDITPLLTGRIDGFMTYTEWLPYVMSDKLFPAPMKFSDFGLDAYGFNIIANRSFAHQHSGVIDDFVNASLAGYAYARDHPDDAVAIYLRRAPENNNNPGLTAKAISHVLQNLGSGPIGAQSQDGWRRTIQIARESGLPVELIQPDQVMPVKK